MGFWGLDLVIPLEIVRKAQSKSVLLNQDLQAVCYIATCKCQLVREAQAGSYCYFLSLCDLQWIQVHCKLLLGRVNSYRKLEIKSTGVWTGRAAFTACAYHQIHAPKNSTPDFYGFSEDAQQLEKGAAGHGSCFGPDALRLCAGLRCPAG